MTFFKTKLTHLTDYDTQWDALTELLGDWRKLFHEGDWNERNLVERLLGSISIAFMLPIVCTMTYQYHIWSHQADWRPLFRHVMLGLSVRRCYPSG